MPTITKAPHFSGQPVTTPDGAGAILHVDADSASVALASTPVTYNADGQPIRTTTVYPFGQLTAAEHRPADEGAAIAAFIAAHRGGFKPWKAPAQPGAKALPKLAAGKVGVGAAVTVEGLAGLFTVIGLASSHEIVDSRGHIQRRNGGYHVQSHENPARLASVAPSACTVAP